MCGSGCAFVDSGRRRPLRGRAHRSIVFRMNTKADEAIEQTARALVARALRLSESERVWIAAELLESLEGPAQRYQRQRVARRDQSPS